MSIRRALASLVLAVLVAGVVAFAVGPQALPAQEVAPIGEARARAFIDLMAGGRYAQAFELFTPQMKAAMPVERLSATWNSLTAQAGPFQGQIATSVVPRGVLSVVVVTCAFERATFDVQVTVNPANLVGGLGFRPAVQAVAYAPPAYATPAAYKESEVTVGTGQWVLPATLTMPFGPGPVAAVVLVHGSGPGDRDATVGQIKQFKDLALGLASRGIAVLRYDKRTRVHANLMREFAVRTVKEETIDDALAAAKLLRSTPRVDPNRVFVLGHSLGGMLVPRIAAAAESSVAGFIVMAGAARPLQQALVEQSRYLAMADGTISAEERAQIDQFEQVAGRVAALGPADTSKPDLIFGAPASYWLDLRGYDPPAAAAQMQQPMLVLQGERDYQVTMEEFNRWKSALANRTDVTFHSYLSLNHLFVAGKGMSLPAEYNTPGHVSENVVQDIATWIMGVAPRQQ